MSRAGTRLLGLIRTIEAWSNDVELSIEEDTDDTQALCIYYKDYSCHFRIDGLGLSDTHLDWLARVIGERVKASYEAGHAAKSRSLKNAVDSLKSELGI